MVSLLSEWPQGHGLALLLGGSLGQAFLHSVPCQRPRPPAWQQQRSRPPQRSLATGVVVLLGSQRCLTRLRAYGMRVLGTGSAAPKTVAPRQRHQQAL